jgi:small-conductance mechanosensitive channel
VFETQSHHSHRHQQVLVAKSAWSAFQPTCRQPRHTTDLHLSFDDYPPAPVSGLAIAASLALFVDPLVESVFNVTHIRTQQGADLGDTLLFGAGKSISTAALVYASMVGSDIIFHMLGRNIEDFLPFETDLKTAAPSVSFCLWAALTISAVKRTVFLQRISGRKLGRIALYDRLIDIVIALISVEVVLDVLQVDYGMGLQSIVAGSGVGALVFSLASKDLASAIVSGFILQAWDAFEVGDDIRLGDGTEGTVKKIGLVETELQSFDNIVTRFPNSQLTNTRVSNLSRMEKSRVNQKLRFNYKDLNKLPQVLDDIKTEVAQNCPKLITDGSKPFQAFLVEYAPDHVSAVVNCHFTIPVASREYAENRQEVLLAISRAVERNGVSFALPSIVHRSEDNIT